VSSDAIVVDGRINDANERLIAVMQTKLLKAKRRRVVPP
jgi:hypothetical protein